MERALTSFSLTDIGLFMLPILLWFFNLYLLRNFPMLSKSSVGVKLSVILLMSLELALMSPLSLVILVSSVVSLFSWLVWLEVYWIFFLSSQRTLFCFIVFLYCSSAVYLVDLCSVYDHFFCLLWVSFALFILVS